MTTPLPDFYTLGPLPVTDLGFIQLPTYYAIISLVYCLGIFWFYKRCEDRNLPTEPAMNIALIVLGFGFVGARLFHVFFEHPTHYLNHPAEIFYVWQGGFVFFGGFLFAYLGAYLYARKQTVTFWLWHDTLAPVLALGYAIGRIACFLAGCCYGRMCQWPWAVEMQQVHVETEHVTTVLRHPTPLYATGMELLLVVFLLVYERKRPPLGHVFLYWVIGHGLARIVMESFRADPRGAAFFGFSISTLISVGIVTAALITLFRMKKKGSSQSA